MPVQIKKVYDKTSHTKDAKHGYPPVRSVGTYTNEDFNVTIHMTPELRNHPVERKALLRHEVREAKILAKQEPKNGTIENSEYSHREARKLDPSWMKGKQCFSNTWDRLGYKIKK
ncbi:MAG: hypothetical protein WC325_09770 [Candidatus Bathyarchaeia archaeon]|jgi:hypothetical protein